MVNTRRKSYKEGEEPAEGSDGPARSTRARTASITSDSGSEAGGTRAGTRRRRASSDSAASASPSRTSERTPRKALLARYRTEEKAAGFLPPVTEETKEEDLSMVVRNESIDEKSDIVVSEAEVVAAPEDNSGKTEKASEDEADIVGAPVREQETLNSTVNVQTSVGSRDGDEARTDAGSVDVTGAETAEGCAGDSAKSGESDMTSADQACDDVEMSDRTIASDGCDAEMPEVVPERTEGKSAKLAPSEEGVDPHVKSSVEASSPSSHTVETEVGPVALSDKKLADIQRILGTSPVQTSLNGDSATHHSTKAATTDTFTRIKCPQVPRGMPKSGRFWKPIHTKMERSIVRKRDSYEVRMKKTQQLKVVKDLERQMKAEHKEKMEDLRKRREHNTKKAAENALKAEVYQVLKNPNKIKRMKKKQLRQLTTRDTTVVGKSVLDD